MNIIISYHSNSQRKITHTQTHTQKNKNKIKKTEFVEAEQF